MTELKWVDDVVSLKNPHLFIGFYRIKVLKIADICS